MDPSGEVFALIELETSRLCFQCEQSENVLFIYYATPVSVNEDGQLIIYKPIPSSCRGEMCFFSSISEESVESLRLSNVKGLEFGQLCILPVPDRSFGIERFHTTEVMTSGCYTIRNESGRKVACPCFVLYNDGIFTAHSRLREPKVFDAEHTYILVETRDSYQGLLKAKFRRFDLILSQDRDIPPIDSFTNSVPKEMHAKLVQETDLQRLGMKPSHLLCVVKIWTLDGMVEIYPPMISIASDITTGPLVGYDYIDVEYSIELVKFFFHLLYRRDLPDFTEYVKHPEFDVNFVPKLRELATFFHVHFYSAYFNTLMETPDYIKLFT